MSSVRDQVAREPLIVVEPPTTHADRVEAVARRRLAQISDVLGLDPNEFERAHDAKMSALDGGHGRIMSEQCRKIVRYLPEITDDLVRARIVALFNALAQDASD